MPLRHTKKGTLMADEYGESRSKPIAEQVQRRLATLDFDELRVLRSLHGKLDVSPVPREQAAARVGGLIC
jgi:hypothetical protein